MTHVWWRQCHLDLYRPLLPGLKEALSHTALAQLNPLFIVQSRRRCYEHAKAMSDMLAQVIGLGTSAPVTDIDLPGCAYQCVRMLYHGLQTAADEMGFTAEGVRELASVCLQAARRCTAGPACASIVGQPPPALVFDPITHHRVLTSDSPSSKQTSRSSLLKASSLLADRTVCQTVWLRQ